jgi:hypothetical protein
MRTLLLGFSQFWRKEYECVHWIHLLRIGTSGRLLWTRFHKRHGNLLTTSITISFTRRTMYHGVSSLWQYIWIRQWQTNDTRKSELSMMKSMVHITHFIVWIKLFFSKMVFVTQYHIAQKHTLFWHKIVRPLWLKWLHLQYESSTAVHVQWKTMEIWPKFLTLCETVVCVKTYVFVFRTQRSTYKPDSSPRHLYNYMNCVFL